MSSNNDRPATTRDLDELQGRLTKDMDGRFAAMDGRLAQMEEYLVEQMRDMQTEILLAFRRSPS